MAENQQTDDGFQDIDLNPPSIDWKETRSVEGKIVARKRVPTQDGDRDVLIVQTDKGDRQLWHSAGLARLFDMVENGDIIQVTLEGELDVGKPSKMRTFKARRKPAPDAPF